jgi:hypothetical protein
MIDTSARHLWDAETLDARDLIPAASADSPRARRLAVLAGCAYDAGEASALLAWFCDVAHVLMLELSTVSPGHSALMCAVTGAKSLIGGGDVPDPELRWMLDDLSELEGPDDSAEAAAAALATWALSHMDGAWLSPEQAWQTATVMLAAVAEAADANDTDPEPTIARCAEMAYARLFGCGSTTKT